MYNDVNITTYRLIDYSNSVVKNILKEIDKYHPNVGKQLLHRGQLIKVCYTSLLCHFANRATLLRLNGTEFINSTKKLFFRLLLQ